MQAETYDEWKAAATELDALEGHDPWKEEDESPEYDAALVAARLRELDDARVSCDARRIHFQLRTTLTRDLGGIGALRLYKHSHIGTKKLIERYNESAERTLAALLDVSEKQGDQCPFTPRQLLDQIKYTRASFGRSALLLSGGGTFGMNHIGVVKCLWDNGLLPRIISGASAGSIVSAVLCSKTDEEIPGVMHDFCNGDLDVFEKLGESEGVLLKLVRMFQTGGLFDISHLTRVMKGMLGDMTFQEAYYRTRRILNIPVSTSSHFELPRLLNYITAPNVIIWSAVCTSCSVPLVYKKASLLAKDPKTREHVSWDPNPDATWIDGSVDNDLPMTRLAEMFNINHFIVSQVNPHVIPFLAKDDELIAPSSTPTCSLPTNSSWLANSLSLARGEVVHRMQVLVDMGVMPSAVTKLRGVLSQRYSGDINIFPHIHLADFPRVLTNPTPEYMAGCMLAGQRATWPKMSRIKNHLSIEMALDAAVHQLEGRAMVAERGLDRADRPELYLQRSKSSHKISRADRRTDAPSPVLRKSAPTSPFMSRASLRLPPAFAQPHANSAQKRSQHHHHDSAESTVDDADSDRDYFAESDWELSSSTSPCTSGPTMWPSAQHPVVSQGSGTSPPPMVTAADRRNGVLLNLSMTPAGASAGQKKPGDARDDDGGETECAGQTEGAAKMDRSGTRGMLLRKKSFGS
jgi:TAG lipase/steryl ester hydrolase/phospholipase A2/LPA acyltransferase